jgi:hypothetical protein
MPLRLPVGKRLAVNIGVDFDAMCAFSGHMATLSPSIPGAGPRAGGAGGLMSTDETFARWRDNFTLSEIYDCWSDN